MQGAQQPQTPVLAPGPYLPMQRTAIGPDWSEGSPFFARWAPNGLSVGKVVVQPANFGTEGGIVEYRKRTLDLIGTPMEPTSLPHRPVWNVLTPAITWNLQVLTAQQLASFQNSNDVQAPQIPLSFTAPGTASLMK